MQVRYQAAPRPDRGFRRGLHGDIRRLDSRRRPQRRPSPRSATQRLEQFLELGPHLAHDLLALRQVLARLVAGEALPRAADREALVVEETADLADHEYVLAL